ILTSIKISCFMDRQNIRVVEGGSHSRFMLARPSRRLIQSIGCQKLDGAWPIEIGITREIYLAHAAASEQTLHFIMTDYFSDHRFVAILADRHLAVSDVDPASVAIDPDDFTQIQFANTFFDLCQIPDDQPSHLVGMDKSRRGSGQIGFRQAADSLSV